MKRDDLTCLGLPPKGPVPTLDDLRAEFAAWCEKREPGQALTPELLAELMDRRQRWWLTNFTARWDWATEDAARHPSALCTPLELAGAFMTVVREHSSRGEFERVLAGGWQLADYLHVDSVMDTAFARVHRVPVDGPRSGAQLQAELNLKRQATAIVQEFMIVPTGDKQCR